MVQPPTLLTIITPIQDRPASPKATVTPVGSPKDNKYDDLTSPGNTSIGILSPTTTIFTPRKSICQASNSDSFTSSISSRASSPTFSDDFSEWTDKRERAEAQEIENSKELLLPSPKAVDLIVHRGYREARWQNCLQCVLKDLPCDNAAPSCKRCQRSGIGHLCLSQRLLRFDEEGFDESPWTVRLVKFHEDEKVWERKRELEAEVLDSLQDKIDKANWVLPHPCGIRGGFVEHKLKSYGNEFKLNKARRGNEPRGRCGFMQNMPLPLRPVK